MKKLFFLLMGCGLLFAAPSHAFAEVNIFACEPEWGALAGEIGGDHVSVYTTSNARQNVHFLSARPSLLAAMRKADLVLCNGASLEIGWLPVLQQKAAGPDTVFIYAADQVEKLDVPTVVDRSMGDVHPDGNPHIHLDPRNIETVANVLAEKLAMVDEANAATYRQNLAAFKQRWQMMTAEWQRQAAGLKGTDMVVYHTSWAYLFHWLGINVVAALEPKPGIPPTASHLESVLQTVKGRKLKAIIVAPFENEKAAQWLSSKTGIPVVHLPFTVGGNERADSLEHLFTETIRLLNGAGS